MKSFIAQVPSSAKRGTSEYGQCQEASSGWCELTLQTLNSSFLYVKFLRVMHISFALVYVARTLGV